MAENISTVVHHDALLEKEAKLLISVQSKVHQLGYANKAQEALAKFAAHMLVTTDDEKMRLAWWDRVHKAAAQGVGSNAQKRKELTDALKWKSGG